MRINREILKGHIDTMILSLLEAKDMYGYQIAKTVRTKSGEQFELKEATLYLSLKRMEQNELISSYWGDEAGQGARRKYYRITESGLELLRQKRVEWTFVKKILDGFIEGGEA